MIIPSYLMTASGPVLSKLSIDFTTATLDSRISLTRAANTATTVGSNGLVQVVNANIPRFNYDPVTLACRGLLIEESRSNVMTNSQDLSGSNYVPFNTTVATNVTTSPDGTSNADKMTASAGSNIETNIDVNNIVTVIGVNYTASVFVKQNTHPYFQINVASQATVFADFDLSNGTIGSVGAGNRSQSITSFGNGWYRCSVTYQAGGLNRRPFISVAPSSTATRSQPWSPVGTESIYVWGYQFEAGDFRTSYIPTTSASVTRNADVAVMTGSNFSSWWVATHGSMFLTAINSTGTSTGIFPLVQFDDGTALNIITNRCNTLSSELFIVNTVVTQAQITSGTIVLGTQYNCVSAWDTNSCAVSKSAGTVSTDSSASIPTVTQARLGSDGTNYLNGHLVTMRYWPQRLINSEVQSFSK